MKAFLATCILTGALLAGGCATKKYVRNTTTPIQAKVDQVGEQTTQNTSQINDTRNQVKQVDERAQSGIGAATERASAADAHAGEAMNKANQADQRAGQADQKAGQADQKAEMANQGVASLRAVISNIDDFKLQNTVAVPFGFNQSALTKEAKTDLDKLAGEVKSGKRYFVAVEGYTDSTGSKAYNDMLSRKRADAVVEYLVAKGDVPIYRIHMIGLGEEKPVETAANRAARAKNRRVEVKVFSADQVTATLQTERSNSASRSALEQK